MNPRTAYKMDMTNLRRILHEAVDALVDAIESASVDKSPPEFTQHVRPSWAPTANVYLRAWRALRDEKHPGVAARGKTRIMTRAAADAWLARAGCDAKIAVKGMSIDDEVLAELGAVRVKGK